MNISVALVTPRTIMITGATDGIGKHTAEKLAADGNHLLIHGRNPDIGSKLELELCGLGAKSVKYFDADLSDLDQVERLAANICSYLSDKKHLDVLINNAGIFDPPAPAKSAQGYDATWAVNVMAPFLLTCRLLPFIAASQDACPRIITTSSISQSWSLPPLDDLFLIHSKPKSAHQAYSDSKLGDFLFTVELANRLAESSSQFERIGKIKCLTMDPGTVNTKMLLAGWGPCGIPVKRADNTYRLATEYGAGQESGSYHFGGSGSPDRRNEEKLDLLWTMLEESTNCNYAEINWESF